MYKVQDWKYETVEAYIQQNRGMGTWVLGERQVEQAIEGWGEQVHREQGLSSYSGKISQVTVTCGDFCLGQVSDTQFLFPMKRSFLYRKGTIRWKILCIYPLAAYFTNVDSLCRCKILAQKELILSAVYPNSYLELCQRNIFWGPTISIQEKIKLMSTQRLVHKCLYDSYL
jgi:hypothetical protein